MEQSVIITAMTCDHIDQVTTIYREVLEPSYISFSELNEGKAKSPGFLSDQAADIFREQLISLIDSLSHGFFVAMVDNEVIGFALASLHKAEAGHLECWLDDIGVSYKWQRRGIAQLLANRVFDWGSAGNARYFLLESGVKNDAAHSLFHKLGFRPLATVFWRNSTG